MVIYKTFINADPLPCFLCLVIPLLYWANNCIAQQLVTYPLPESVSDQRTVYPVALLKLCERKTQQKFSFQPSRLRSQQDRNLRQLSTGEGIDIVWTMTTKEREANLLPIRIPIDKGLLGWRLLLVRSQDKDLFNNINSTAGLSKLLAVQGHDWPDVDVLKANNLKVTTGSTYEGLFKVLGAGHVQYFPRAITEVWGELNSHQDLSLEVEPSLVLHYPSAIYFFVNKKNQALADSLDACLKQSISDGSFDELFQRHYGSVIAQSHLDRRKVIELSNPTLPEATPINNSNYWYVTRRTQ